jgi:hypothetical protein
MIEVIPAIFALKKFLKMSVRNFLWKIFKAVFVRKKECCR